MAIKSVLPVKAHRTGCHQQGRLGGIPHQVFPLAGAGVVAEQAGQHGFLQGHVGLLSAAIGGCLAVGRPEIFDRHQHTAAIEVLHRHPVLGEGAGLVGADHRGAAEGFHRRQLADDRPPLGHAVHADGQGDGHDRGQLFRDRPHRQGHGSVEHLLGPAAARQPHQEGEARQQQDHLQKGAAEPTELAGQGGGEVHLVLQGGGDAAHFGGIAGGHHQALALPSGDETAGIGHADPLGQQR